MSWFWHFLARHGVEFRQSWYLLVALAALPTFFLAQSVAGRLVFSSLDLIPARASSWRTRLAWIPSVLLALAVLSTSIALAGPRRADTRHRVERQGIAIMMVVDISSSMSALDLSEGDQEKTRLDAVKSVFEDFVNGGEDLPGRPDDAIGLVSFARYPDSRCPLTLDHENLTMIADSLQIVTDRDEDGTAIGDGLGLAVERLKDSDAKSKIAILLTDGVNNAGEETPIAAAELAKTQGVKVYTVGAGTNQPRARVRATDPFTGQSILTSMPVQIDEDTLEEIANRTGGHYFRATDAKALRRIYHQIDQLERTKIVEDRQPRYHEYYVEFMAAGLLLFCVAGLTRQTAFRRLP